MVVSGGPGISAGVSTASGTPSTGGCSGVPGVGASLHAGAKPLTVIRPFLRTTVTRVSAQRRPSLARKVTLQIERPRFGARHRAFTLVPPELLTLSATRFAAPLIVRPALVCAWAGAAVASTTARPAVAAMDLYMVPPPLHPVGAIDFARGSISAARPRVVRLRDARCVPVVTEPERRPGRLVRDLLRGLVQARDGPHAQLLRAAADVELTDLDEVVRLAGQA